MSDWKWTPEWQKESNAFLNWFRENLNTYLDGGDIVKLPKDIYEKYHDMLMPQERILVDGALLFKGKKVISN